MGRRRDRRRAGARGRAAARSSASRGWPTARSSSDDAPASCGPPSSSGSPTGARAGARRPSRRSPSAGTRLEWALAARAVRLAELALPPTRGREHRRSPSAPDGEPSCSSTASRPPPRRRSSIRAGASWSGAGRARFEAFVVRAEKRGERADGRSRSIPSDRYRSTLDMAQNYGALEGSSAWARAAGSSGSPSRPRTSPRSSPTSSALGRRARGEDRRVPAAAGERGGPRRPRLRGVRRRPRGGQALAGDAPVRRPAHGRRSSSTRATSPR